jgi:hypothetical protein
MCSGDSKFAYKDFYYVIDIVRRWNSHHPTAQRDTTTHSMDVKDMNHFPTPIIPHNLALIPHNNRLGIHHRNNTKVDIKTKGIHLKTQDIHLKTQDIHLKTKGIHLKTRDIHLKDKKIFSNLPGFLRKVPVIQPWWYK